jgi:uncharacterized protein YndB with AHSA1/START domain
MMDLGSFIQYGGRPAVRFERTYPHPIDRVWASVSEPGNLAHWFPSKVDIEPRVGGTIAFSGDSNIEDSTGVVLAFDPPRRLAFSWGEDELHFELEALDSGSCRLVLINVLADRSAAARNAAGWTVCLGELDKVLDQQPHDGPHGAATTAWQPLYDAYIAAGLPSGAPVPGS